MESDAPWPPPDIVQRGLRQRELCDFLGLNYKAEALNAKLMGLSTHDYLQCITGWQLRRERYYPTVATDLGDKPICETFQKEGPEN
ncbi:MAG: hypothetical protein AAF821_24435 [Cyanobacteria bacterium P01_D01_bin.156]